MPYKEGKFKCQKCGTDVHRKETIFCMKCRAIENTGIKRVDEKTQKENRKAYKKAYFQKNKEKILKRTAERKKNNPILASVTRGYQLKYMYNLTIPDVEALYQIQKGCCYICETPFGSGGQRMVIDHNHKTDRIRALLCHNCNTGLGHFKDNIEVLNKAIKYLEYEKVGND